MKTVIVAALTGLLLGTLGLSAAPAQAAPAEGTIRGVIVNEAGKPVAGARVFASYPGRQGYDTDPRIRLTGADGRFSFKAQAGTATLGFGDVYPGVYAPTTRAGVVVPAGGAVDVRQTMKTGAVLTGTVARADGARPPSPLQVLAVPLDQSGLETDVSAFSQVTANKNGAWRMTGLKPGRFQIQLSDIHGEYLTECVGGRVEDLTGNYCTAGTTAFTVNSPRTDIGRLTMTKRHPRVTGTIRGVGNKPVPGVVFEQIPSDPDSEQVWGGPGNGTYVAYTTGCPKICFAGASVDGYAIARIVLPSVGINQTGRADVRLHSITALKTQTRVGRKKATVITTVAPKVTGATRTGTVTIRYKKTNGKTATRTATVPRSGKVSIHLRKAKSGKRTLTIVYSGNADTGPKTVKTKVRVR